MFDDILKKKLKKKMTKFPGPKLWEIVLNELGSVLPSSEKDILTDYIQTKVDKCNRMDKYGNCEKWPDTYPNCTQCVMFEMFKTGYEEYKKTGSG